MSKEEYKAFLSLLMCSDPTPLDEKEHKVLIDFADKEAKEYGCTDWIQALHVL